MKVKIGDVCEKKTGKLETIGCGHKDGEYPFFSLRLY